MVNGRTGNSCGRKTGWRRHATGETSQLREFGGVRAPPDTGSECATVTIGTTGKVP